MDVIVTNARNLKLDPGMDKIREQITYVHNTIAKQTSYKLENACKPENIGFIRTSYGALVKGESVCEGYARAMKSVMDRLGIPCVLVQGVYRHTADNLELHMWNYVQLDGKWYGVDVTMDDPVGDGRENSELLLVGDDIMGARHIPSGIVSPANREFTYPSLSQSGLGFYEISNNNGLLVEYMSGSEDGMDTATLRVSYNGMGYQEAAKKGKYILARFYQYYPNTGEYISNEWAYADPTPYDIPQDDHALIFPVPHVTYAEFAVTDLAPSGSLIENGQLNEDYWYYKGDPLLFEAMSGMIYNPNGTYVAPPYPQAYSPSTMGRIYMGQTYEFRIPFNDKLIPTGTEEVGYKITCTGPTGAQYSKVEDFRWDGDRTITFRFTPSSMFADESVIYTFQFTGLVGEKSGKAPIPLEYVSSAQCASCAYRKLGYDWNVFGQPSLLENSDLSMTGWETSDGSAVSELLKNRLALVVTSPSKTQTDAMNDLISSANSGTQVLASETYNITLTLCKSQIIKTGQGVRVSVGFPAGYGPDDEGVTFKAYHFKRNDAGEVIGVEEIGCVVTKFGLILTCDAFSPFAIAAVKDNGSGRTNARTAILSGSYGGKITASGKDSIFTLDQNGSASVTVTADSGYMIEQLTVNGVAKTVTDAKNMTFTLSYNDLRSGSNIIDARFVAESVLQREVKNGETAVLISPESIVLTSQQSASSTATPTPSGSGQSGSSQQSSGGTASFGTGSAVITFDTEETTLRVGDRLSIEPEIELPMGINSYQWYKDGAALAGQTSRSLTIESVSMEDAGIYQLRITTVVAENTSESSSGNYTVTVLDPQADDIPGASSDISAQGEQFGSGSDGSSPPDASPEGKSGGSTIVWILLLILVLAAAAGIGLYIKTARKKSGGLQ